MDKLTMWGVHIYLLIGALLCLVVGGLILAALWTSLRIWWWHLRRRKAWLQYRQKSRRADGKQYPPYAPGICDDCRRTSNKIYHPQSGPRLCPPCYETYWRQTELWITRHEKTQSHDSPA